MRVLVLGSGGREHALAWAIGKSPLVEEVLCAPGSDGIAQDARVLAADPRDARALVELVKREGVSLVVIGPEDLLAAGVADRLRDAGISVFGPGAAAARLESSKRFAKEFMARHGIPTAAHASFASAEAAEAHVRALAGPCVVKADGLAAGKGVFVCDEPEAALAALHEVMRARRFGASGAEVVAQDHKRVFDGDRGENTGGMGACSPAPPIDARMEREIVERIVAPTVAALRAEGLDYRGAIFIGLMFTKGGPQVIEYNARFGDPETQALLFRLESDLVPLLVGAAEGRLPAESPALRVGPPSVCVVMASENYPRECPTGRAIAGLEDVANAADAKVFHSATRRRDGRWETTGGRVLGVTARGSDLAAARARAYELVGRIRFDGAHWRRDIGAGAG